MKRVAAAALTIPLLIALSACGGKKKVADTPPAPITSASASTGASSPATPPSPSASGSASVVLEFSVDGVGAYPMGGKLTDLKANPGLAAVTTGVAPCPQVTTAQGIGEWKDIRLSFHSDGTLFVEVNAATNIPTPSGAYLGTPLAQLKKIYASIQSEDLVVGTRKALLVTTATGQGILFDLTPQNTVATMTAGDSAYLKTSYQHGTSFC